MVLLESLSQNTLINHTLQSKDSGVEHVALPINKSLPGDRYSPSGKASHTEAEVKNVQTIVDVDLGHVFIRRNSPTTELGLYIQV